MTHQPVLLNEVIALLCVRAGGVYVDGTVGSAGHASAILERAGAEGFLLGIDRDGDAMQRSERLLGNAAAGPGREGTGRFRLVQGSFADMVDIAKDCGIRAVDGILLDLGVSSEQLGSPERGFSFQDDGPLDMRMDRSRGMTAEQLVNRLPEEELSSLIWDLGEERRARRIARAIVRERTRGPLTGTRRLADVVGRAAGGRRSRIHPATRTFQALRIRVNDELIELGRGLEAGVDMLKPGGRMAVISFHSMEDRIVKHFFLKRAGKGAWAEPPHESRRVTIVTRKPVRPAEEETRRNPRARSAKLRVAERCADEETEARLSWRQERKGES